MAERAVERLKEREHRGYHYEAAQASFELLLRREAGAYEPLFELEGFRVVTEKRASKGASRPRRRSSCLSTANASSAPPRVTALSTRSTGPCVGRSPTGTHTLPISN